MGCLRLCSSPELYLRIQNLPKKKKRIFKNKKNDGWSGCYIAEEDQGGFEEYEGLLVPMPDGKVACLQCGKRLSNLNNGRRHFASAHQLNQPAKCNVCQHIFKNSQTRDSHLRQKHGLSPAMIKNAVKMPMGSTQQQPMSMPTQQSNPNWSH